MPRLGALQERAKKQAQMLVALANSDTTEGQQLQRYLKAWCDSGHDLRLIEEVRTELNENLKRVAEAIEELESSRSAETGHPADDET